MKNGKGALVTAAQRKFANLMARMTPRHPMAEIWQDFMVLSAVSFSNSCGGAFPELRMEMFHARREKYSPHEMELFAQMLEVLVDELERDPNQDFLGDLFVALGLHGGGPRPFLPYPVARVAATLLLGDDVQAEITEKGWVDVGDPGCGTGSLLLAAAGECRRQGVDCTSSVLFTGWETDLVTGLMCYVQLSVLDYPGYVVIGDTFPQQTPWFAQCAPIPRESPEVWFTPMYYE